MTHMKCALILWIWTYFRGDLQNFPLLLQNFHEPKILTVGPVNWNGEKAWRPEELEESLEIMCANLFCPNLKKVTFPCQEQQTSFKCKSVGPLHLL